MEGIREIQKKYGSKAMMLAIAAALVLIVVGQKAAAKGLVLGALFSVINLILMGQTLPARLHKTTGTTFAVCLGGIWLRYLVLAIPLILAIKLEQFNVAGAAVGLFMVQMVILWDKIVARTGMKK